MSDKMTDKNRGFYAKYHVSRLDGSSEKGKKHENCEYFVLDLDHDPHAIPALEAYTESCRKEYPKLARDLFAMISDIKRHSKGIIMIEEMYYIQDDSEFRDYHLPCVLWWCRSGGRTKSLQVASLYTKEEAFQIAREFDWAKPRKKSIVDQCVEKHVNINKLHAAIEKNER